MMCSKRCSLFLLCCSVLWLFCERCAAQTLTTLYNFSLTSYASGLDPSGTLAMDGSGVLYGVTSEGGANNKSVCDGNGGCGTVFSLAPPASAGGAWTETVLWSFGGSPGDGFHPNGGPMIGSGGILYGTTGFGGLGQNSGYGILYSLTPPASAGGAWTETVLWSFGGSPGDGTNPQGELVISKGIFYGTTSVGGANGAGTVYSLTPPASAGGAWTETVLWSFGDSPGDGTNPQAGLAIGAHGVLYGTTSAGGSNGVGVIFSLTPPASQGGSWAETILYSPRADTGVPTALVIGKKGVLYGAMGEYDGRHGGSIFSLTPPASSGRNWVLRTLWSFPRSAHGRAPDGEAPNGPLVLERKTGNLYGTAYVGGSTDNGGTIFGLSAPAAAGGKWTFEKLCVFDGEDGALPTGLVMGNDGELYGSTQVGGNSNNGGTVFSIAP